MFIEEEKVRTIELYFKYGKKLAPTVRELSYPSKRNLWRQIRSWEAGGGAEESTRHKHCYSDKQKQVAVEHHFNHGRCLASTSRALGYPCIDVPARWVSELYPDRRRIFTGKVSPAAPFKPEVKRQIVMALCTQQVSVNEIARRTGVNRVVLYKQKDEIIGNSAYQTMRKYNEPSLEAGRDTLREEVTRLNQEIRRRQMGPDILKKAEGIIKKDPGISISHLNNREETKIAGTLRQTYPPTELFRVLGLTRSSYFYHRAALKAGDEYAAIRTTLTSIFDGNYQHYGYRRLYAMLRHEGGRLLKKVVRKLMMEEQFVVSRNRRRHYSPYCGEIEPVPDNLTARDFKAQQLNQKWLTNITELQLPAGKAWSSPAVDRFDGKIISWSLSTHPDVELINITLDSAVETLNAGERPMIRSDRGGHYRWSGWLERTNAVGPIRSMSRKGCSSDNAAREGFFGRLRTEMYYGHKWSGTTPEKFMQRVDAYIRWYNEWRIKLSLGAISPEMYRQQCGLA